MFVFVFVVLFPPFFQVAMDLEHGYTVAGISRHLCSSLDDVNAKLEYGRKSRKTSMYSTGLASESTGAFFEMTLKQLKQEEGYGGLQSTVCKLLLVDVPATTKLVAGSEKTRVKEGPLLSKSLFTFEKVVKSLASKKDKLTAPFENSAFTHILHDYFGLTSIVMGMACLTQGESKTTKETMKLLSYFRKMSNYPMEANEMLLGVLMKYRSSVVQLLDRIEEMKVKSSKPKAEDEAALQRLKNVEAELLKAQISGSTAQEDGTKCFKMLELFKAKYAKVVEDKAKQARELILR